MGVTEPLRDKAAQELKLLLAISAYLYVCFGALLIFKAAVLHGQGIGFAPWGVAVVKALILAKFIMLGEMLHVGDSLKRLPMIWATLYKAGVFLIFLVVLTLLEEAIVALFHGRPISSLRAEFGGAKIAQDFASCFIMLLILIPFFTFRGFDVLLGKGKLQQLLLARPGEATGI